MKNSTQPQVQCFYCGTKNDQHNEFCRKCGRKRACGIITNRDLIKEVT
jgi:ribosomal protein L40E